MSGISLLCPTRGRPKMMDSLVSSAAWTAGAPHDLQFVFYIDEDDEASFKKLEELQARPQAKIDFVTGPRIVLSEMWNKASALAEHDVMMHCGDDILFRSNLWDSKVLEVFDSSDDKIVFVHGRDGYHDAKFGTHGFIHRKWMETVGYFVPPYFSSDFNDTWLNDVANMLGRRVFLNDVFTEHMHYIFGKSAKDATYAEREARGARDEVLTLYNSKGAEREEDARKLREVMT